MLPAPSATWPLAGMLAQAAARPAATCARTMARGQARPPSHRRCRVLGKPRRKNSDATTRNTLRVPCRSPLSHFPHWEGLPWSRDAAVVFFLRVLTHTNGMARTQTHACIRVGRLYDVCIGRSSPPCQAEPAVAARAVSEYEKLAPASGPPKPPCARSPARGHKHTTPAEPSTLLRCWCSAPEASSARTHCQRRLPAVPLAQMLAPASDPPKPPCARAPARGQAHPPRHRRCLGSLQRPAAGIAHAHQAAPSAACPSG